jgi:hypothetical protein
MYNAMLTRVVSLINQVDAATKPPVKDNFYSDFYNQLFAPEIYREQMEQARKQEALKNKAIIAVTGVAVLGEAYHLARRSGLLDKLKNR